LNGKLALTLLVAASLCFSLAPVYSTPIRVTLSERTPGGRGTSNAAASNSSAADSSSETFFLKDTLDVNIVFVGFDSRRIDTGTIERGLPSHYRPHVRAPVEFYPTGTNLEELLGIEWSYNYHFLFTDTAFSANLFEYILSIGGLGAPTVYQLAYNNHAGGPTKVQITENLRIPASAVEAYLLASLALPADSYTVVFINGYEYLPFHTYQFIGEPDPDSLVDFGYWDSRQMNAWGGTYGRIWFYDFSAGPIYWDDQHQTEYYWNPHNYVIPCIWDYDTGAVKKLQLTYDIRDLTRYVAINLLFTASPLYRPLLDQNMHINLLNFQDTVYYYDERSGQYRYLVASDVMVSPQFVTDVYEHGEPNKRWLTTFEERPLQDDPAVVTVLYNDYPWSLGRGAYVLFWQNPAYYTTPKRYDSTIPIMTFTISDETAIDTGNYGVLGWADDDYATGTQAVTYALLYPDVWNLGYGLTSTFVHEAGHHVSLSHPHDGYDYEHNFAYGPEGRYCFVWVGDQVYSLMSYMSNVFNFGVFDKDNLWRDEAALAMQEIRAHWHLFDTNTQRLLSKALEKAEAAFHNMDYLTMNANAMHAYWAYVQPLVDSRSQPANQESTRIAVTPLALEITLMPTPIDPSSTMETQIVAAAARKED
jgi:hypothetical protein